MRRTPAVLCERKKIAEPYSSTIRICLAYRRERKTMDSTTMTRRTVLLRQFMDAKDAMDEFKDEIKERRKRLRDDLKQSEEALATFMQDEGIDSVTAPNGKEVCKCISLSVSGRPKKKAKK